MHIFVDIIMWYSKYDNDRGVEKQFVKAYKKDRDALIQQISKKLLAELKLSER